MAANKFGFIARSFSTSSASFSKLVASPIGIFGIEGRYAHALYSAATKEKKLDIVEKELNKFQALLKRNTKFSEFVSNPSVKRNDKKDLVLAVLKEQNFCNITTSFFGILADNGRFGKLNGMLTSFNRIMSAHRGEVPCVITTAKPLEASHLNDLKAALSVFVKKGEVIQLETKVDPSIIGGMVVSIGDKYVDMSMSTKIKTYTNLIKDAV